MQTLINAVVPLQAANAPGASNGQSPESVYNVSASANQARLRQPIPVIYGRHLIFLDFAAQPYAEYVDNEQYFHALYCVGQGRYNIPDSAILIDDTRLSSFTDVQYRVLQPGNAAELGACRTSSPRPRWPGGELRPSYCRRLRRLQAQVRRRDRRRHPAWAASAS